MRVFNKEKTTELLEYDLEKGRLEEDKLIIYKPEVKEVPERSHLEVLKVYPNGGRDVKRVVDVPGVKYSPARTEEEKILVYIPYSEQELAQNELNNLRMRRKNECFSYINRGQIWYDRLTQEQLRELKIWYQAWLDVTKTKQVPIKPTWLI